MVRNGLPDRIFFGLSLFVTNLKGLFSIHFDKGLTEKLKLENLSFTHNERTPKYITCF